MTTKVGLSGPDEKPITALVGDEDRVDPLDHFLYSGHIEIVGDIMAPLYSDEEWEEFFEASCAQLDGTD